MSIKVVDVSGYNGAVNWPSVYADGVRMAILKIIRKDLNRDKQFDSNFAGCNSAGMPWDVYNYSYATTVTKAQSDMALVCDILDKVDKKYFYGTVWFDFEDECQAQLSKSAIADILNAAQTVVESRGYKFGVYTGMSFFKEHIDQSKVKCKNWWIARYYLGYKKMPVATDPNEKYKPAVTTNIVAWQYTSSGVVSGISGVCDLSVKYDHVAAPAQTASPQTPEVRVPTYKRGNIYTLQVELKVRTGPGVTYAAKKHSQLTTDGKKHDVDRDGALDKGTRVTCKEIRHVGSDIWMCTPSGWLAAYYKGDTYIK